jgi:hypothetical protein
MPRSRRRNSSILASPQPGSVDQEGDAHRAATTERSNDEEDSDNEELYLEIDCDDWDDDDEVADNTAEKGIGMSLADYRAQELVKTPTVQSWKDVDCNVVTATIGEATDIAWTQGKDELGFFRRKVFLKNFNTVKPSLLQIVNLLLGPESNIARLFEKKLGMKNQTFKMFLRTFFVQSAYRLSTSEMFMPESYVKTVTLMKKEEYTKNWKEIGACNLPNDQIAYSHVSGPTFWAGLESSLNDDLQSRVIPSFLADEEVEKFRAIFDDDKMHFNMKRGNPTAALQQSQHIRDNRRGPVCHHAVLSASGVVIGCAFERPGDKTSTCTQRIVKSQIVPMQGGDASEVQNLTRLSVGGDRAYQNKELLYDTFMPSGANVLGTKARSRDNPFVFGMPKLDQTKDKRQDVPMNGAKTLMIKKV